MPIVSIRRECRHFALLVRDSLTLPFDSGVAGVKDG
jgi:hypothetical protein